MDAPTTSKATRAGGCLIALCLMIGVLAGATLHQPTIGVLAGFGTGVVLALLIWLFDRRR